MLERLTWKRLLLELLLVSIPAAIVGTLAGGLCWLLLSAILLLLLWHFYYLIRLSRWLERPMLLPAAGRGSWEPLFYGLHQMLRRHRRRRRDLGQLIRRFRKGAETLPDAVILITKEGNIFWCNGLARQYLGLRWPDDNGQNIVNLLRYPEFSYYLRQHDFSRPLTLMLNSQRQMEFRIMPYSEGQRLMVVRDITHQHALEGMRRNFFANVSHELRTPLTVLQGYLELIDNEAMDSSVHAKALHTMQQQTRRMDSLLKQLLTLSRIEATPVADLQETVDIPLMLQILQHEAESLSGGRHKLCFYINPDLKVSGNSEQLRSAITNLIYNAINHTPEGTSIEVGWCYDRQGAHFWVCDNGPGIASEHLPRLTERFYRVNQARSRSDGGSGLGLAIVKHVLNQYNARLEISSEPYKNTCFSFMLAPDRIVNCVAQNNEREV